MSQSHKPACLAFLVLGTSILTSSMSFQAVWTNSLNSDMSMFRSLSTVAHFCQINGTKMTQAKIDTTDIRVAAWAPY